MRTPGPPGGWYVLMCPGLGWKLRAGVLGVHAALDHVPAQRHLVGTVIGSPGGHADLLLHEVHAGEHLGDRVLHLDARVHLHEVERPVLVEEHLDRPRAHVVDGLGAAHRRPRPSPRAGSGVITGARRLLHELLVAALHRAVALAQVDHAAVRVAEDLELDVPRAREVLLDVHVAVAERRERLERASWNERTKSSGSLATRIPFPPPPAAGLDDHREADLLGERERLVRVLHRPGRAGHDRHARPRSSPCARRPCRPSPGSGRRWAR
jgi:hypothetical protein